MSSLYKTYLFKDKDPVIADLHRWILDSKYSYEDVAARSGVTVTTLQRWFYGATKKPQFATLQAVARAVGASFVLQKGKVKHG